AWVKMKQGQSMTEQDVKDFCKGKIAHFKIPRYVVFVNDFPINISGKIQKYLMREESIKKLGLEEAENIKTA
ncbi:MAG: AMP-binding protein, partial [Methanoregula sp.]|uniref:AMP-binding enzyme n=1 Tax=Methanoregula sp. TaxID=2052170 RepID=UPI003BAF3C43